MLKLQTIETTAANQNASSKRVRNLSNRMYFNVFHSNRVCENHRASLGKSIVPIA